MVRLGARRVDVEIVVVVLLGALLRFRQFLSGRSLWVDEALVANDLSQLSVIESITQRSPRGQMAPAGFWVVSNAADAISSDEMMLRLFPLLTGLALVVLAAWYAVRHVQHRIARVLLVGVIALSPSLVHYSAEIKQYGVEAFLAMVAVVAVAERSALNRVSAVVLASILLVFSIPALLIVPILGLLWFHAESRRRGFGDAVRYLAAPGAVILAGWAVMFAWAQLAKPGLMQGFWSDAFAPVPIGADQIGWWIRSSVGLSHLTLSNIGISLHVESPAWVTAGARIVALALWGLVLAGAWLAVSTWRTARRDDEPSSDATAGWLTVVPVVGVIGAAFLLASVLELYPFRGRLILVLVPLTAVAAAHGLDVLLARRSGTTTRPSVTTASTALAGIAAAVIAVALVSSATTVLADPYDRWDIEPAIEWIADNVEEGDAVVPYFTSSAQTQYYRSHLDEAGVVAETYLGPLTLEAVFERVGDRRTWFLHGHIRDDRDAVEVLAAHPAVVSTFRGESVIALLLDPSAAPS